MKSTEVYRVLKLGLSPVLKSLGFKREKAFLSWARKRDDKYTVLWCQVSRDGWDEHLGSQFTVEFQRSVASAVGSRSRRRERIAELLSDTQREEVRSTQNRVIASLRHPPAHYFKLSVSPEVTQWYLAKFEQDKAPYPLNHDIWLRYAKAEHVEEWSTLLAEWMPRCVEDFEKSDIASP
jgi:hypothetical protein